jgi:Mrp family chromosome partitioning ATPase
MGLFNNLSKGRKKKNGPELKLIDSETPFAIRQAYKSLYTNVLYLNIDSKCKKIAVTSPLPSECKSTVSANLSLMLSENLEDKKILLIDSDMRSPRLWTLFGTKRNAHGLS